MIKPKQKSWKRATSNIYIPEYRYSTDSIRIQAIRFFDAFPDKQQIISLGRF